MTFTNIPRPTRSLVRRSLVAVALCAGAVSTTAASVIAVPIVAHAAPAAATVSVVASRARTADAVADQASAALSLLDRVTRGEAAAAAPYEELRDEIAAAVAGRVGADAVRMQLAWAAADTAHQQALLAALTQLGVPYRRNTSKAGVGFDCSGITTFAWARAGHTLTRQSSAQIRAADPRTIETAQAGDLVQYPGHVMMWLGVDNTIVHAIGSGRNVEVDVTKRKNLRFGDPTG